MTYVTRLDASKWRISFREAVRALSFILKCVSLMVAGSFLFLAGSMYGHIYGADLGFLDGCSVFAPEYLCKDALFLSNTEKDTSPPPEPGTTSSSAVTESEWQRMLRVARTCGRINKERGFETYISGSADRIASKYHCLTNDYQGREQ